MKWVPEPCDLSASPYMRLAGRVRELRVDAEITQGELARRMGTHRPIIGRCESGKHTLHVKMLVRIAAALEVDLETLCVVLDERWCASARVIERAARSRPLLMAARRSAA